MWYYHLTVDNSDCLVVETDDGIYDLSAARAGIGRYGDLVVAADITDMSVTEITEQLLDDAERVDDVDIGQHANQPIVPDEVWAAGVTYKISEEARESESDRPDVYLDVYDGERPEVFFKATPNRTVGPGDAIGIRGDSNWDVPEPELALVLYNGEIVGYTVGNDVSSRDLEGENPLYLPQAKVYAKSAAIGPCVAAPSVVPESHDLGMEMEIRRDGETVFHGETNTGEMVRSCEELAEAYRSHNAVPEFAVLMTGTSLVPDDDFTLRPGDEVAISLDHIGTLRNVVETV